MESAGRLKDEIKNAEAIEENEEIAAKTDAEISDNELENVDGGGVRFLRIDPKLLKKLFRP